MPVGEGRGDQVSHETAIMDVVRQSGVAHGAWEGGREEYTLDDTRTYCTRRSERLRPLNTSSAMQVTLESAQSFPKSEGGTSRRA